VTAGPLPLRDFAALLPYSLLLGGSLLILLVSLGVRGRSGEGTLGFSAAAIALAAGLLLPTLGSHPLPFGGLLAHDPLGLIFAAVFLTLLFLAVPLVSGAGSLVEGAGAVFGLMLLAACGGLLMIFSNHLLTFFVGLEILSLSLYVLTALSRDERRSAEAAFKYFLLGAVSSALLVFGAALLWGALGTLRLDEMARLATAGKGASGEAALGAVLVLSAAAFKLGLVPFHMWLPDVYEGAPSYVVAWMSGAVKVSVLPLALRLVSGASGPGWLPLAAVLSGLAIASMLWGSFAALYQTSVKRILAYSTIAHAGYGAIALVGANGGLGHRATAGAAFYFLVYGISSLAAFAVVAIVEARSRSNLDDLSGLARRKPLLALVLAGSLLSMAGLPPLGGFFAKFNLFALAVTAGHFELLLIGVFTSLVALGFYLKIIVSMYMRDAASAAPIEVSWPARVTLAVSLAAILLLGTMPGWMLDFFSPATGLSLR
jgi:NADH-quinone oxidoreductase subunit N